jgi:transposase-like protein
MSKKIINKIEATLVKSIASAKRLKPIQRKEIIRLYASGEYTKSGLARMFDVHQSSVSKLILRHDAKHQRLKRQHLLRVEKQMVKVQKKALGVALAKADRLSPYQAVLAGSILHDKLYPPKNTEINLGDNRKFVITYPNFNRNARKND